MVPSCFRGGVSAFLALHTALLSTAVHSVPHRIIELVRLEKTLKIVKSNHNQTIQQGIAIGLQGKIFKHLGSWPSQLKESA